MQTIQSMNKERGYVEESYAPMPTRGTLFWRRNIIWQAWRFVVLNLKIIRIVAMGHS